MEAIGERAVTAGSEEVSIMEELSQDPKGGTCKGQRLVAGAVAGPACTLSQSSALVFVPLEASLPVPDSQIVSIVTVRDMVQLGLLTYIWKLCRHWVQRRWDILSTVLLLALRIGRLLAVWLPRRTYTSVPV